MGEVLSVLELKKSYEVKRSAFSTSKETVKAIDGISFDVDKGRTLGVVGESGSGKSTLARCLILLEKPDSGKVFFVGEDLTEVTVQKMRKLRKQLQIIFQDPYSSLNPRKKVMETLAEPLLYHDMATKPQVREKVMDVLNQVGLSGDFLDKFPHEMSGGQRQRVAIGRALTTNPSLIVADEPVSSLDVSIQAQIINLFMDIKERAAISMVFISHDLNIVRFVSDEIIVMYRGRVVEMGERDDVFYHPLHPYTKMLIDCSSLHGNAERRQDDPFEAKGGCAYCSQCEVKTRRCLGETPSLTGSRNHMVACFLC